MFGDGGGQPWAPDTEVNKKGGIFPYLGNSSGFVEGNGKCTRAYNDSGS